MSKLVANGMFNVTAAAEKGAKPQFVYWDECPSNFKFCAGKDGEEVYHIVYNTRNTASSKYSKIPYLCIVSHTKNSTYPSDDVANSVNPKWMNFQTMALFATDLMLARKILAEEIDAKNLVVTNGSFEGKLFVKFHTFSSNTGNFYLNTTIGVAFMNGASSKYNSALYRLPPARENKGIVIKILIYYYGITGHGSMYVITDDGFTYVGGSKDGQYVLCNKHTLSVGKLYEFISVGNYWCCSDGGGDSYSLDNTLDFTQNFEDPID